MTNSIPPDHFKAFKDTFHSEKASPMTDTNTIIIPALETAAIRAAGGPECVCDNCRETAEGIIRAVLTELDRQGWGCVPKVPTAKMTDALFYPNSFDYRIENDWVDNYADMLKAAPKLGEK